MTLDPWFYVTAQLLGTYSAPAVRWPRDRVHRIVARDDSDEAPAPALTPAEAQLLAAITRGLARPPELAAELGLDVGTVSTRLTRMQGRGLVRREARGIWTAAA